MSSLIFHAANILALVSRRMSAGLPRALRAARPPARATAGVRNTWGFSRPSVPALANWVASPTFAEFSRSRHVIRLVPREKKLAGGEVLC